MITMGKKKATRLLECGGLRRCRGEGSDDEGHILSCEQMEAGGGLRAGAKGRIIDAANIVRPFHNLLQRRRFIELKQKMKIAS